jgi:hypothetical protein
MRSRPQKSGAKCLKKLATRRKAAGCFRLTALPSRGSVTQKLVPSYLSKHSLTWNE